MTTKLYRFDSDNDGLLRRGSLSLMGCKFPLNRLHILIYNHFKEYLITLLSQFGINCTRVQINRVKQKAD